MKTVKKVVSLVMTVVIMITTTPILQAYDSINLDVEKLKALQGDVNTSVMKSVDFYPKSKFKEELPTREQLLARYKKILEISEESTKVTSEREMEEYINEHMREALEIARQDSRFDYIKTDEEKAHVAFYTFLFDAMMTAEEKTNVNGGELAHELFAAFTVGATIGLFGVAMGLSWMGYSEGLVVIFGFGLMSVFTSLALGMSGDSSTKDSIEYHWNSVKNEFMASPFEYVAKAYKKNNFAALDKGDEELRQVFRDVVDIGWYIALDPSVSNMKDLILVYTVYWDLMSIDDRREHLRKTAEILRSKSENREKEQFNNLRIGLEER